MTTGRARRVETCLMPRRVRIHGSDGSKRWEERLCGADLETESQRKAGICAQYAGGFEIRGVNEPMNAFGAERMLLDHMSTCDLCTVDEEGHARSCASRRVLMNIVNEIEERETR